MNLFLYHNWRVGDQFLFECLGYHENGSMKVLVKKIIVLKTHFAPIMTEGAITTVNKRVFEYLISVEEPNELLKEIL